MTKKIEILSPAGSYESLKAAIAAGADAVYVGGSRFGARAYANNLQEEQLLEAIDYVHLHGRKIYLTINTLLKDKELKQELYEYLLPYYKQGIDAVIVQDTGVLQYVKEQFPDLPIHASTQMTITNVLGAKFLEHLGVERVVTARELQLDEIQDIAKNTKLEIESFVHGALCYCYSGQCLYSSLIGGRSGNRGQCAQPCRLPYKLKGEKETHYLLSLKDICTLDNIPELVESGIYSFKIEGRMKKPEYVALVTAMYRKYVDLFFEKGKDAFHIEPKDREMLMDLYNRGGFHRGYYYKRNGRDMLSLTRPNHAGVPALEVLQQSGRNITAMALVDINKGDVIELSDERDSYTFPNDVKKGQKTTLFIPKNERMTKGHILNRTRNESLITEIQETILSRKMKEKIKGKLKLSINECSRLVLKYEEITVEVFGDMAQEAISQPMDKARIEKQMYKTGNTPFEFEELEIEVCGNVFMPMQSLNELRRKGLEALETEIVSVYRRETKEKIIAECDSNIQGKCTELFAYVEQTEQLDEVLRFDIVNRIYLDCNAIDDIWENPDIFKWIEKVHEAGKQIYLCMPHVFRKETIQKFESAYDFLMRADWDGVLIRNYESYVFLKEHDYEKPIVTDYNMYLFNQYAKKFWLKREITETTAPVELNYGELKEVGLENSELIVYGYLPMMISAQCIEHTTSGCKHQKGRRTIVDRYQKEFVVKNHCDYCYNVIYNATPLILADQKEEIHTLAPRALRMHFTTESPEKVKELIGLYESVFIKDDSDVNIQGEFTRGHFKRGIK